MIITKFCDVRTEVVNNFKQNRLIPIIGSGFSKGCRSKTGCVPSGTEYKEYMLKEIFRAEELTAEEQDYLKNRSFSDVASYYQNIIPKSSVKNYLRNNFSSVKICDDDKEAFLSIDWQYIYTLNIDDAIENNSKYNHVIYANRRFEPEVFNEDLCVVKLHGDVNEMITFSDSQSQIFSQEQYVFSLHSNLPLLSKLNHDSIFINLIIIGCGLQDEIDLLSAFNLNKESKSISARYICCVNEPTKLESIQYSRYGITHALVFDSYSDIYRELYEAWQESKCINEDELHEFITKSVESLNSTFEENKSYLLHGKSLVQKNRSLTIPYFFISREPSKQILENIPTNPVQLIVGSSCSGKTYLLIDLARRIRSKDVYVFESKNRLNAEGFKVLIERKNSVILADDRSFRNDQIETILRSRDKFKENNTSFVLFCHKSNRDVRSLMSLLEYKGILQTGDIPQFMLSNKLSKNELDSINPLLAAIGAGIFAFSGSSIIDNLLQISYKLSETAKYQNIKPDFSTDQAIATLIILAIKKKIYSKQAIDFGLLEELYKQTKRTAPLIENEISWSFEINAADNSPEKWVLNADYWLYNQLGRFSDAPANRTKIISAYRYIFTRIFALEGKLNLNKKVDSDYKDYILFDNINDIFYRHGRGGLILIRELYEDLNDLLSSDPQYMHQRAKCYIRSALFESDSSDKNLYLQKAFRDTNVAEQVFEKRYHDYRNDKILISLAHVRFTQAIIACYMCFRQNYSDINLNNTAVYKTFLALQSPHNKDEYLREIVNSRENFIKKFIEVCIADKSLVSVDSYKNLGYIFSKIREFVKE
ncbi:MAG: SIR2 family protein [Christensenella sp.]|nr:SIR2 family protein [Christensenella sp.]